MALRDTPAAAFAELRLRLALRRLKSASGVPELVARVVSYLVLLPAGVVFAILVGLGTYRSARVGHGLQVDLPLAALLFGVWQAWTAVALTLQEQEAVDLRRFLAYPLSPARVYLLAMLASLVADPFSLFWSVLLAGAFVGAAFGHFGIWLVPFGMTLLLFATATACGITLLQGLSARLLRARLAKEILIAAIYVGLASGLAALAGIRRHLDPAMLKSTLAMLQWVAWPAALALGATRRLFANELVAALPWMAGLLASATAAGVLSFRLALGEARSGGGGPVRHPRGFALQWLPGRTGPLLEREMKQLLRHPLPGVLLLVVPAMAAFVAWKATPWLGAEASEVLRALPLLAFALYTHLTTQVFWINAFGWDRGGARLLFLAPLDLSEVLAAKNGAAYALAAVLYASCAGATVALTGWPPAWALLAAGALHAGVTPWLHGLGNLCSVLNPRVASLSLQRSGSVPALSALAGMAIVSGVAGLFSLPVLLAVRLDEGWVLPVAWALLGGVGLMAYRRSLPRVGRLLGARREPLLAAVTGDDA
jgi:ABC-2 type transport system permease protein